MAKRFIDTKIWDKSWFRNLKSRQKLLWFYLMTKCEHAGILDADFVAASFFIGEEVSLQMILGGVILLLGIRITFYNRPIPFFGKNKNSEEIV